MFQVPVGSVDDSLVHLIILQEYYLYYESTEVVFPALFIHFCWIILYKYKLKIIEYFSTINMTYILFNIISSTLLNIFSSDAIGEFFIIKKIGIFYWSLIRSKD